MERVREHTKIEVNKVVNKVVCATWATMMLSRGVEPVKVMSMGGWRGMDTMMRYIREAGIDIKGIAGVLKIHDSTQYSGVVKSLYECI